MMKEAVGEHRGIWRIMGAEPLRMRTWEGDSIVYHPMSGQTHRVDVVSALLLRCLTTGSASLVDLCREAEAFLELDDQALTERTVGQTLESLRTVGLVEVQVNHDGDAP